MISVVLPARNERRNVVALIQDLQRVLEGQPHEVILVDDASTDGTVQAVAALGSAFVKVHSRSVRGLGSAVAEGIGRALGDVVVVMDSDYNHPPTQVPLLLNALPGNDAVSGSRFLSGGGMVGRFHSRASRIFNRWTACVLQGELTDYTNGFFAVKKEVLGRVDFDKIFYGHGDYAIRLWVHLERLGLKIREIPVVNAQRRWGSPNRAYILNLWRYWNEVRKLQPTGRS